MGEIREKILVMVSQRASALLPYGEGSADDDRVSVLAGDWRLLERHAPFDVFFGDGGGKRDDPEKVVELLAPGGLLLLDDFTPSPHWPPRFEGEVDELRLFYLTHPALDAAEVLTTPTSSVVVAARRA
ncbi:hypothetical protein C6W96_19630 [Streptomyces sp. CS149]|nr:hypothetical protein C6W96_19630 [Streptomyces sp. CS149]